MSFSDGWLSVIILIYPLIVLGVSPSIQQMVPVSVPVVSNKYIKVFCASLKFSGCSSPAFSPSAARYYLFPYSWAIP